MACISVRTSCHCFRHGIVEGVFTFGDASSFNRFLKDNYSLFVEFEILEHGCQVNLRIDSGLVMLTIENRILLDDTLKHTPGFCEVPVQLQKQSLIVVN